MIFVARHAETDQGAARVVQVPGAALSALGRSQATRLGQRMRTLGITRIVASDLVRAVETATIVSEPIALPVEQDAVLRERDFGELRGLPYTAIPADPYALDYVPPRGESWPAFHARVAQAWDFITRTAGATPGHLLVVTHGLVCQALAQRHWHPCEADSSLQSWANTSLSEIEPAPPWKVLRLACAAHLIAAPGG